MRRTRAHALRQAIASAIDCAARGGIDRLFPLRPKSFDRSLDRRVHKEAPLELPSLQQIAHAADVAGKREPNASTPLYLNGDKVGEGRVEGTAAMIFSADDTWVQIDIDAAAEDVDHLISDEERLRLAMARQ